MPTVITMGVLTLLSRHLRGQPARRVGTRKVGGVVYDAYDDGSVRLTPESKAATLARKRRR
jgi:hypothetical protein